LPRCFFVRSRCFVSLGWSASSGSTLYRVTLNTQGGYSPRETRPVGHTKVYSRSPVRRSGTDGSQFLLLQAQLVGPNFSFHSIKLTFRRSPQAQLLATCRLNPVSRPSLCSTQRLRLLYYGRHVIPESYCQIRIASFDTNLRLAVGSNVFTASISDATTQVIVFLVLTSLRYFRFQRNPRTTWSNDYRRPFHCNCCYLGHSSTNQLCRIRRSGLQTGKGVGFESLYPSL
jgi:hypothetical protein